MIVHVLLVVFYFIVCLWCIRTFEVFKLSGIPRRWVVGIFAVKVLAGFLLWAIYTYHYTYRGTSDAFRYFDDAMVLYHTLGSNPRIYFQFLFGWGLEDHALAEVYQNLRGWGSSYNYGLTNDNPTIIRFNMILALFSFGYYHVHTVFFSFFSLIGLCLLYKSFYATSERSSKWLFLAVFCIPTVLFWASGVLKEPILILALGAFLWGVTHIRQLWSRHLFVMLIALIILIYIKPYVLFCLLPGTIYYLLQQYWRTSPLISFGIVHLMFFLILILSKYFYPAGSFLYVLQKKRADFYNVAAAHDSGSVVAIPQVESWAELILRLPQSFIYTYFRPFFGKEGGVFRWIASVENALILVLIVFLLSAAKRVKKIEIPLFLYCLSFVLSMAIVIATCIPVLGAVVRYKLPALPFLVLMFMLMSSRTVRS